MLEVLIEASAGSKEKHSFDQDTLEHRGVGETPLPYPYPYGFVVATKTPEGDCVDCYVITGRHFSPGEIVHCEPVGLLEFFEEDEDDHKVLAALPNEKPGDDKPGIDTALREQLSQFIYGIFQRYPDMKIRVGELLSAAAAEDFIDRWRA